MPVRSEESSPSRLLFLGVNVGAFCVSTELVLPPMTVRSVGMVDTAQYMNGTLDSGQKTRYTRPLSNIFSYDESLSDDRDKQ